MVLIGQIYRNVAGHITICTTKNIETCKTYDRVTNIIELKDSVKFDIDGNTLILPGYLLKDNK